MTTAFDPSSSVNWITLIVGPFLGTSLAFLSARLQDGSRRYRERVSAANLALILLKNQYNDFLLFRRDFRADVTREGLAGDEPIWALVRPSFLTFGNYEVNFKDLGFLFERPGHAEVFDAVELAQICYRDLVALSKFRTEHAQAIQKKASEFAQSNSGATWTQIAKEVGADLTALMTMVAVGLALRTERNEKVFTDAFSQLRNALDAELRSYWICRVKRLVGKDSSSSNLVTLKEPAPKFAAGSMPPLPKLLADAIAKTPMQKTDSTTAN